ncbi:MAG: VWA domain-containing protein [Acidobacteriota bacterium]
MTLKANGCLWKSVAGAGVLAMVLGAGSAVAQDVVEAGQTSTLTVTSRLVVLDVVVVDAKGNPVTTLDQSKFRIYEDKIPQAIKNFDAPTSHLMPPGMEGKLVVDSAADLPKIGRSPVNVLVFDELNTPFHDLSYAREQMMKYLLSLPEVLPVPTLFVAAGNTKMAVLHDYTQSRAELIASVKKHTADVDFTMIMAQLNGGKTGKDNGLVATLGALSQIAESVKGVPGRKNLIWVGKGYNNAVDLQSMSESDHDRVLAVIKQVTDRMLAARVVLYTIDPDGPVKADEVTAETIDPTNVGSPGSQVGDFGDGLGFYEFSKETGGRVISGRNDIDVQLAQVSKEGTEYYTLSYAPTSMDDAARPYRKIRVLVSEPGYRVMTREGYFSGAAKVSAVALAPRAKQPKDVQYDLLTAARTTLAYTGLHVMAQRTKPGYTLLVNANDLQFNAQADGTRLAEVTIVAVSYNTKGKESGQRAMELKEELGPNDVVQRGSQVGFAVPMIVPAFTQRVRFVVRDASTGTMGSAEGKP